MSKVLGVDGPDNKGSEYFFYNIVHVVSYVEENGTSLLNYANADAISDLVDRLLTEGVPASAIVILTMYKAELKLLILKVSKSEDGQKKYRAISTIDAYQGQEGSVVILDLVVAKHFTDYKLNYRAAQYNVAVEADADEDGPQQATYSNVTAFTRDYHRLCVALTRAINGLIVVGQLARLLSSLVRAKDPMANTLHSLATDAMDRELIATDKSHFDTHPKATKENEALKKRQSDQVQAAKDDSERFAFYTAYKKWGLAAGTQKSTEQDAGRGTGLPIALGRKKHRSKGKASAHNHQMPGQHGKPPPPPPPEDNDGRNTNTPSPYVPW